MWFWENLVASIICASSILECSPAYETKTDNLVWNPEKIETVIQSNNSLESISLSGIQKWTEKQISICLDTDSESSFTHKNVLEQVLDPKNTVLEYPIDQLFQKYNGRTHPFAVSGVRRDFRSLLWANWVERTTSKISQKLTPRMWEITSDTKYKTGDTLRFSIIDPLLKDDFPHYLSDQLKEEWFESFSDPDASTIDNIISNKGKYQNSEKKSDFIYDIVVKRAPSWKSALALYRNWELFMATYVSIWRKQNQTLTWQYKAGRKNPFKRSHKYDNAPMPEAVNIKQGRSLHQWFVNWYELSHWCVRVPGVYADIIYSLVDTNSTDIFISKNLYNKQK